VKHRPVTVTTDGRERRTTMQSSGSNTAIIVVASVVGVIVYLYVAYCLQRIAKNLKVSPAWFAWIPILNVYLWCRICGHGIGYFIMLLIPVLNIVIYVLLCLGIAHVCGRSRLYGILLIIPIVDLVIFWMLATSDKNYVVQRQRDLPQPPPQA
jgi:hypothetical protein